MCLRIEFLTQTPEDDSPKEIELSFWLCWSAYWLFLTDSNRPHQGDRALTLWRTHGLEFWYRFWKWTHSQCEVWSFLLTLTRHGLEFDIDLKRTHSVKLTFLLDSEVLTDWVSDTDLKDNHQANRSFSWPWCTHGLEFLWYRTWKQTRWSVVDDLLLILMFWIGLYTTLKQTHLRKLTFSSDSEVLRDWVSRYRFLNRITYSWRFSDSNALTDWVSLQTWSGLTGVKFGVLLTLMHSRIGILIQTLKQTHSMKLTFFWLGAYLSVSDRFWNRLTQGSWCFLLDSEDAYWRFLIQIL